MVQSPWALAAWTQIGVHSMEAMRTTPNYLERLVKQVELRGIDVED